MNSKILVLNEWLKSFSDKNGIISISDERLFQHEEEKYDEQYQNDPGTVVPGKGAINLLNNAKADFQGAAIEIGCGTGVVSQGLLTEGHFPLTIISDPSPKFVKITKNKLRNVKNLNNSVHFAVLQAEDLSKFPEGVFSAIIMRSVLHHITDVKKFLFDASIALGKGGILLFEEPCTEGYILMGALAQFIPLVIEKAGNSLSPHQYEQIKLFINTVRFYTNRRVDKSQCEDKHLFRVDELMKDAEQIGLTIDFYRNVTLYEFDSDEFPSNSSLNKYKEEQFSFSSFFYNYLKFCMQFDSTLLNMFSECFTSYCSLLDDISLNGNAPYMNGVFICKKK